MTKTFWVIIAVAGILWPVGSNAKSFAAKKPVALAIPRIHISAQIESRGLNSHRFMLPPTTAKNVVWYNAGTVPGQPGTAIMYGHLTDNHFKPAIFSSLHTIHLHDEVVVTDVSGNSLTFLVTKIDTFRSDSITSTQLSPTTKFSHLTLYTCAGHWVPQLHRYSEYLVVYTSLQKVTPKSST